MPRNASSPSRFIQSQLRALATAHPGLLARFLALTVCRAVLAAAVIFLMRDFLAGVLAQGGGIADPLTAALGQRGALWALAGLLLASFIGGSLCLYGSQVAMQRLVRLLELDLMELLLTRMLRLPVAFFDSRHRGDIVESIRQDVSKTRAATAALVATALSGAQALAYAGSAAYISPRLVLFSMPVLLLAALPARRLGRQMRSRSTHARGHAYRLTDLLLQLLHGIRVVKVYAGEEAEIRNSIGAARRYFDEVVAGVRLRALTENMLDTAGGLMVVLLVLAGGFEVLAGRLTLPSLVAVLVAARAAIGPLHASVVKVVEIQRDWASMRNVRELLALEPELRDRDDARPLDEPLRTIRFERVSFAYGDGTSVLRDVSFDLSAGQQVGIVGPSGAGKSTVVSLLARFYDPTDGRILVNGRDLREYRRADLYKQMALVTQEPFAFSTSVRDNIRYGSPHASDADVERAAGAAGIHADILALPRGYDTVLGVGGRLLSGGQLQRVNVARAILKDARLVLLDEATSSLDSISEARIQQALERLMRGRLSVTVAHRLSTLGHADLILVLDGGRLVASGSHDRLLAECPLYHEMWHVQRRTAVPSLAGLGIEE